MRGRLGISFFYGAVAISLTLACAEETGVCTAYNSTSGTTYCKDGWTKAECQSWSDQKINGVTWNFYAGQTCSGRGTPATP